MVTGPFHLRVSHRGRRLQALRCLKTRGLLLKQPGEGRVTCALFPPRVPPAWICHSLKDRAGSQSLSSLGGGWRGLWLFSAFPPPLPRKPFPESPPPHF